MGAEFNHAGGMSPGGNRLTQIPSVRLYLDPNSSTQGRGFWTGKYGPNDTAPKEQEHPEDIARLSAFQERGSRHEVIRYYAERPVDEEETIKSMASAELFDCAKGYFAAKRFDAYEAYKKELSTRAFLLTVKKAIGSMAGVDRAGAGVAHAGRGKDSMPANRDKKIFLAIHGGDDETSSSEQDEVTHVHTTKPVSKAILTKPSEAREKKVKEAKKNSTAKTGYSKSGKKTYDYRKTAKHGTHKVNPPGEKKTPANTPPPGTPDLADGSMVEPQPEKLANVLHLTVDRLHKLAASKDEKAFVSFFKQQGPGFLAKHKVTDAYLSSVYSVLKRQAVKSMTPKKTDLSKRGVTLAKTKTVPVSKEHLREDITEAQEQVKKLKTGIKRDRAALGKSFRINLRSLKKGSEEYTFAESMLVSGVNTLAKLATFLTKGYDLSKPAALKMAEEFHSLLKEEGALS